MVLAMVKAEPLGGVWVMVALDTVSLVCKSTTRKVIDLTSVIVMSSNFISFNLIPPYDRRWCMRPRLRRYKMHSCR